MLIDVAVILLVIIIIAVIWWVGHRPKPEPAPSVPQYSGQELVDQVNIKTSNNDYVGAIRLLEGQKSVNEPGTQALLAGAYANKGDDKKALEIYKKLSQQDKLDANETATAANIAARSGDKQLAIELYQKAIERTKSGNSPTGEDMIAVYEAQISSLEQQ